MASNTRLLIDSTNLWAGITSLLSLLSLSPRATNFTSLKKTLLNMNLLLSLIVDNLGCQLFSARIDMAICGVISFQLWICFEVLEKALFLKSISTAVVLKGNVASHLLICNAACSRLGGVGHGWRDSIWPIVCRLSRCNGGHIFSCELRVGCRFSTDFCTHRENQTKNFYRSY